MVLLPASPASQPKLAPSVQAACECCASSETEHEGRGAGGAAVQFMSGAVNCSGEAEIAHMLNSVRHSVSVWVGVGGRDE